jgi:hypothetical protein
MLVHILDWCEAGGLRRQPAAIGHQQGRRSDAAQTAGGKRPLYPGAVWAGYRLATIRNETLWTRRKECQKTSGSRSGTKTCRLIASAVGQRGDLRASGLYLTCEHSPARCSVGNCAEHSIDHQDANL